MIFLFLLSNQADGKTTTRSLGQGELVATLDDALSNLVSLWIVLVIGILSVSIDYSLPYQGS